MDAQNANKMERFEQVRAVALEAAMWTIDQRSGRPPAPAEVIQRAKVFERYILRGDGPDDVRPTDAED